LAVEGDSAKPFEIVGIAADAHFYSVRQPIEPTIYLPYMQTDAGQANFSVRIDGDPAGAAIAVRRAVQEVDRTIPLFDVRSQRAAAEGTMSEERLFARLSTLFGVLALGLACMGVYGVISYHTAQRTSEIGVRMALGAQPRDISRLVMGQTLSLVAIGVVLGLGIALLASRVVENLLFGVGRNDPLTIGAAAILMLGTACAAGYLPARRARRVSPLVATRGQSR